MEEAEERLSRRIDEQLRLLARDEHTLAHRKRKIHKLPFAQQVLERFARGTAADQRLEPIQTGAAVLAAAQNERLPIQSEYVLEQPDRVERSRIDPRLFQLLASTAVYLLKRHFTMSSPFSGMTAFIASIATSIMLSSGSLVVMCCIHMPGAEMIRVARLSYRPQMRISS